MTHIRYTPSRASMSERKRIVRHDVIELVDGDSVIDISNIVQKVTIENEAGSLSMISVRILAWELA